MQIFATTSRKYRRMYTQKCLINQKKGSKTPVGIIAVCGCEDLSLFLCY